LLPRTTGRGLSAMSLSLGTDAPGRSRQRLLKRRDPWVWEALVASQHRRVYRLMWRLTGDRDVAADLTQETFVAAYRSAHTFNGRSQPEVWLLGVALNCHRSWMRKTCRHEPPEELPPELPDPSPSAEQIAELREQSQAVLEAIRGLPETYRRAVALHYLADVPSVDIARDEGVDPGTVRWRLHRALGMLWAKLAPELGRE